MRLILIGCEYVGKTTLANYLQAWGLEHGCSFHMDDTDFSIPDERHLNEEEQSAMVALPPAIKERFQRFQVYYHLDILDRYEDCILSGYHIEEAIYGPRYYHSGHAVTYHRAVERHIPHDTVLTLLTAAPEVIRARMEAAPHRYPLVRPDEVEDVQRQFEAEFRASLIYRKVQLDTSGFPPEELLERFLAVARPKLSVRDLLLVRWAAD